MYAVVLSGSYSLKIALCVLCIGLLSAESVLAADWVLVPRATYRLKYDDNHLLSPRNPIEVYGHVLDLDGRINYQSEKSSLTMVPKISISRLRETRKSPEQDISDEQRKFDTEDYYLDLNSSREAEWMDFQLNANIAQDSTELNPEEFIVTESFKTRNRWSVNPVMSY